MRYPIRKQKYAQLFLHAIWKKKNKIIFLNMETSSPTDRWNNFLKRMKVINTPQRKTCSHTYQTHTYFYTLTLSPNPLFLSLTLTHARTRKKETSKKCIHIYSSSHKLRNGTTTNIEMISTWKKLHVRLWIFPKIYLEHICIYYIQSFFFKLQ